MRLPDGSEYRERKKFATHSRTAARRWGEERANYVAANGKPRRREVPTLESFRDRFIKDYAKANRQKASGIANKETYLRLYVVPLLGKKRLHEITAEDVQRLKTKMEAKSAKTVNNALSVLSKMLKVAVEWAVIDAMPVTIRLLKTQHKQMEFYEEEEYRRLVEGAAKADSRALVTVLLGGDAGLRRGEMTALEWSDVDFQRGLLHVNRAEWEGQVGTPKGGRSRTVEMSAAITVALKACRDLKGPARALQRRQERGRPGRAGELDPSRRAPGGAARDRQAPHAPPHVLLAIGSARSDVDGNQGAGRPCRSDHDDALHAPVAVGEEGGDQVAGRACARALLWQQFGNGHPGGGAEVAFSEEKEWR